MKKVRLIACVLSIFAAISSNAQNLEEEKIKSVIINFAAAGDVNDSEKLASFLDDNYRIVMNQLFGSKDVTVMTKSVYVAKIAAKEFGGDKRIVSFDTVLVNGNTAVAIVSLSGEKMKTKSIISLVQDATGIWKLVSDIPVII